MILRICEAEVCGPHSLKLRFNDGTTKQVDVSPLLDGPIFEPLRDPAYFAMMTLDSICGTVVWPNGPTSPRKHFMSWTTKRCRPRPPAGGVSEHIGLSDCRTNTREKRGALLDHDEPGVLYDEVCLAVNCQNDRLAGFLQMAEEFRRIPLEIGQRVDVTIDIQQSLHSQHEICIQFDAMAFENSGQCPQPPFHRRIDAFTDTAGIRGTASAARLKYPRRLAAQELSSRVKITRPRSTRIGDAPGINDYN